MRVKRRSLIALHLAASAVLMWLVAYFAFHLGSNRSTASMILLLTVLGIATRGEWHLAVAGSVSGSLAFSYYFVEAAHSFRLETAQGTVTFAALFTTAMIGSRLSVRAQRQTREATARRGEMAKLHELSTVLLSAHTLAETVETAVQKIVQIFGVAGAALSVGGQLGRVTAGTIVTQAATVIPLDSRPAPDVLELYGPVLSTELCQSMASLLSLVFERARSSEERAQILSAQRGDKLRTTVLNALAHSFRTPLTSIKAAASALRSAALIPTAGGRELVAVIDEEADRLDQLIAESLSLARIQSHRENPRREECRFQEIVERVRSRVSRYLGRRVFEVNVPEDLPSFTADRFLLEQMLMQVVDNALKYSTSGSRIVISVSASEGDFLLTVRNEGSNVPENERGLIFDRFYRGVSQRGMVEGTGLGLTIARTIIEAYQGRVWLDMEPQGPAFRFVLPITARPAALEKKSDLKAHHSAH